MSDASAVVIAGDDESFELDIQGHLIEVRSRRSPDKSTPNEDAALVAPVGERGLVLAVADGVGGSPAGREAARIAVSVLAAELESADTVPERLRSTILDAIESANQVILDAGTRGATTLIVAEIVDRKLRSYHVGDSELFVMGRGGAVKARIIPHSPTGFAVEAGLMGEDEAVQHEQRHLLFNVLGSQEMRVEISTPLELATHDTVLLTSDGLVDNLYADEIVETLRAGPLALSVNKLVADAAGRMNTNDFNKPSKPDDLTVVVCRSSARKSA